MDELPDLPIGGCRSHGNFFVGDLLAPFGIFTEVNHFVVFIQQGDPGTQVGNEHQITKDIDVCREDEIIHRFQMFPRQREPLNTMVGPIGHH